VGSKSKIPKSKLAPVGKSVRLGPTDPERANEQTPVWSIALFDGEGPWGRSKIDDEAHLWAEIYPKLRAYESMTWNEILQNKKRDHAVAIDGLIKAARDRLALLRLDDLDELFRFRLGGTMRIWGIRDGRVFKLLWWDPDHEICPSHRD